MAMTASSPDSSLAIDLVVDSSAVIAVLLREHGSEAIIERLCSAEQPGLAAPTRTEILVVAMVKLGEIGSERAREFLDQQAVATVSWDRELADAAAAAFGRFGRGRHPISAAAGDRHGEQGAGPVIFSNQFSSFNPFTRWNSRRLSVTSTASTTRAWAAIQRSLAPIGWP